MKIIDFSIRLHQFVIVKLRIAYSSAQSIFLLFYVRPRLAEKKGSSVYFPFFFNFFVIFFFLSFAFETREAERTRVSAFRYISRRNEQSRRRQRRRVPSRCRPDNAPSSRTPFGVPRENFVRAADDSFVSRFSP